MADLVQGDVELNIGVLGNIKRGRVERNTTVGDALQHFGFRFDPRLHDELRGWTDRDKKSLKLTPDDKIAEDMTVLLLSPMVGRSPVWSIANDVAKAKLPRAGIRDEDTVIQPTFDSEGNELLQIIYILEPEAARQLTGKETLDLLVELRERLLEAGEERFPIVHYATKRDIVRFAEEIDQSADHS